MRKKKDSTIPSDLFCCILYLTSGSCVANALTFLLFFFSLYWLHHNFASMYPVELATDPCKTFIISREPLFLQTYAKTMIGDVLDNGEESKQQCEKF